jgi:ABC-type uncharacterized transport system ATPase subunit
MAEQAAMTGAGERQGASPVPALEARGITKRFGTTVACDHVDLCAMRGEIHGVLGQNGAGKTTLMNAFLGLVTPDAGSIVLNGRPVAVRDPIEAASLGLAMVHQHFSLIGALTVWENLTLGEKGRVDKSRSVQQIEELARRYTLEVDPYARVDDLTTGQRQRVEIVKCLMRDPDVFILDEPTSVLTSVESLELFRVLRQVVQQENRAVLLISHKLDEVLFATDCVTIMRGGRVVGRKDTADTDAAELAREMIGREVSLRSEGAALGHLELEADGSAQAPRAAATETDVLLAIHDAHAVDPEGRPLLDGLSLEVRAGEVLGLAGVDWKGQKAVGDLLSSLLTLSAGHVEVGGKAVPSGRAGAMAAAGIGVIPEDRHVSGCVMQMTVAENLILGDIDTVSPHGFLDQRKIRRHAEELVRQFEITTSSVDAPFRSLSGGNQQKVVLARELSRKPRVLVAAQPTRGLDVGAIEYMTARLRQVADSGVGLLLISSELEEILELSDRVAVIHRGRIAGEMARSEIDLERLGLMMGGQAA